MNIVSDALAGVSAEFNIPADAITGRAQNRHITIARHVWVYLLAHAMPRPTRYPSRCGTRMATDNDGVVRRAAAALGHSPSYVRYALHKVEDMRDDPEFDARVSRIEDRL